MITEQERKFSEFLQLMIYYMCSRCEQGAPHHTGQHIPDNSGAHQHNGEILHLLQPVPPAPHRLFAAYNEYLKHNPPAYIHAQLAHAYNVSTPNRSRTHDVLERTVEYLLMNTRRTWIKHGCEQPEFMTYHRDAVFPPLDTRSHVGSMGTTQRDLNAFAVDTDSWPFDTCSTHSVDQSAPWGYISGYIPINRLHGQLHQPPDRDHYYAVAQIPTHQWLFVYDDIPSDQQALHNNLQEIQECNLMHIHKQTLAYLYTLTKKLQHVYDVKRA